MIASIVAPTTDAAGPHAPGPSGDVAREKISPVRFGRTTFSAWPSRATVDSAADIGGTQPTALEPLQLGSSRAGADQLPDRGVQVPDPGRLRVDLQ